MTFRGIGSRGLFVRPDCVEAVLQRDEYVFQQGVMVAKPRTCIVMLSGTEFAVDGMSPVEVANRLLEPEDE